MPKSTESTQELQISECPICSSAVLKIHKGKNWIIFKKPTIFTCVDCLSSFQISKDLTQVRFATLPSPYSFFEEFFKGWVDPQETGRLTESIRDRTQTALDYLSGASRYAWQVRMILGTQGEASQGQMQLKLSWNRPTTKEEAEKVISDVERMKEQVQIVIDDMTGEMANIQESELQPYEQTLSGFNELLIALNGVKFAMDYQIDSFS